MASRTEKPLGLHNVVSVSMGLIVSMSCLVSLGQGAGEAGAGPAAGGDDVVDAEFTEVKDDNNKA